MVSIMSKRPFGIHDMDIDVAVRTLVADKDTSTNSVQVPVDVDVMCTDAQILCDLQGKQDSGQAGRDGAITTVRRLSLKLKHDADAKKMTASLHHLQIYRIRSRIMYVVSH